MHKGFTQDGYICDQEQLTDFPYRTVTTDYNGCGWVACYNLRRFLGQEPETMDVCREMDGMHWLRFPGPTDMSVMRKYLAKYIGKFKETRGRAAAIDAAKKAKAGIFRYHEEHIPHFITFVETGRQAEDGEKIFRFFNVNDDMWDFTSTIDSFAEKHFVGGPVLSLTVDG